MNLYTCMYIMKFQNTKDPKSIQKRGKSHINNLKSELYQTSQKTAMEHCFITHIQPYNAKDSPIISQGLNKCIKRLKDSKIIYLLCTPSQKLLKNVFHQNDVVNEGTIISRQSQNSNTEEIQRELEKEVDRNCSLNLGNNSQPLK